MQISERKLVLILFALIVIVGGAWALLGAINAEQVAELKKTVAARDKEYAALQEKMAGLEERLKMYGVANRFEGVSPFDAAGPDALLGGISPVSQGGATASEAIDAKLAELKGAVEKALKDKDPAALTQSLSAMLTLGEPAYPAVMDIVEEMGRDPALMQLLSSRPRDLMAFMQSRELQAFYIWALSSEKASDDFRVQTVQLLGRMGGSESIPPLVSLLKRTENEQVVEATLRALGSLKATESVATLNEMLHAGGTSAERRSAILRALGQIGTDSSVAIVQQYAGSGNPDAATRTTAIVALTRSGSESAVPFVVEGLAGGDTQTQLQILRAVGAGGAIARNERVSSQLITLATTAVEPETRRAAFDAVRNLPPDVAVDTVMRGIQGQPLQVRQSGLWTLARINAPSATAAITQIAQNDPSEDLKRFANRILLRRQGGNDTDFRRPPRFRQ